MTDEEKTKTVLSIAAVVCGYATPEEVEQQRLLEKKNKERDRWQAFLDRKEIIDYEKKRRLVRQQLRVSHIISGVEDIGVPVEFNVEHRGFY